MNNPRTLGGIVVGYGIIRWSTAGGILPYAWHTNPIVLVGLSFLLFGAYLTGGIALIRFKAWGAQFVFYTALLDGFLNTAAFAFLSDLSMDFHFLLVGTFLATVVPPGLIAALAWRLRRNSENWESRSKSKVTETRTPPPANRSEAAALGKRVFWGIIAVGALIPWIVGAGVKLYLDSQGRPTHPWSTFLNASTILWIIPLSAWLSLSYIVFAFAAQRLINKPYWGMKSLRSQSLFIAGGLTGAVIGSIWVFIHVFWEFNVFVLLMPLWAFNIPALLLGAALGFALGRMIESNAKSL